MTIDQEPTSPMSLPSGNIVHADVYRDETNNRLAGFERGVIALTGEIEGQQETYDAEVNRLRQECEDAVSRLTTSHDTAKRDLLRRLDDMNKGKRMAAAALDAGDQPQG